MRYILPSLLLFPIISFAGCAEHRQTEIPAGTNIDREKSLVTEHQTIVQSQAQLHDPANAVDLGPPRSDLASTRESDNAAAKTSQLQNDEEEQSRRPVILYIESRNHKVAVHSGSRFTVSSKDGDVLVADATADELRVQYPELHSIVDSGYAKLWAGL